MPPKRKLGSGLGCSALILLALIVLLTMALSSYRSISSSLLLRHSNSSSSSSSSGLRMAGGRRAVVRAMATDVKQFVQGNIQQNKVVVFSKSYCPYCTKAKAAIGSILPKDKFTVLEIESMPEVDAIQDALLEITGGRSVPRVFIGGKFIGGGDDTARLAQSGELQKMLAAAGAL